jgi:hypothetical protein
MKVKDVIARLQQKDPESEAFIELGPDSDPYCVDIVGIEEFDDEAFEDEDSDPVPCKSVSIRAYEIVKGRSVQDPS